MLEPTAFAAATVVVPRARGRLGPIISPLVPPHQAQEVSRKKVHSDDAICRQARLANLGAVSRARSLVSNYPEQHSRRLQSKKLETREYSRFASPTTRRCPKASILTRSSFHLFLSSENCIGTMAIRHRVEALRWRGAGDPIPLNTHHASRRYFR
jgi:hypothetical protein